MKGQPNPEEDPGVEDYVGEEDDDQEAKEVDEEEYLSSMYDDLVAESKEHGGDPDVNFTNVLMERFQSTERKMAKMDAFPEELPVMTDLWNHIQELKDAVARYKFADEKSAKSVVRKRGPTLVAIKKDERTRIMNVQKAKILQILGDDRNRKKLLADLVECEKYFPHTAGVEPTPLKPQKTKRGKRGSGAYQAPQIRDHDYYRGLGEQAQNKMVQSEWKEVWAKEFENMFATNLRPGFRQLQMRKTIEDVVFPNWFARYGDSKIKPSDILKTSQGKSYSTENKAVAARFGKHFKLPPFMKGTRGDPGHTYRVDFVKALKGSDLRYEQYKEQHSQKPEPVPEPQPKADPSAKPISPEDAEEIRLLKIDIKAYEGDIPRYRREIQKIRDEKGKILVEQRTASWQSKIDHATKKIAELRNELRALEAKYESPKPEPKPKPQPKPQPLKFQSVKKHLNPGEAGMFLRNYTGVQTSSPGEEARSYANQIIDEAFPALKVKVDVGRIISPVLQSIVNQREGWGKTIEVPLENKGPFSDIHFKPFSGKANLEKWIKKLETSQLYRKLANISKPETEEVLDLTGGGDEEKEEQISTKQLLEDSRCLQALTKDVKDKSQRISKVIQDDTNQLYTRMSDLEEVMKKWDNFPLHKYGQEVLQASTRSKHILKDTEEGNNTLFEAIGEIILEKLIQDTGNFETIMLQPGDIDVLNKFQESDSFVVKNVADRMLKFSNRLPITSDQKRGRAITGITGAQEFAKTGATRQQTTKPVQPRVHIPTSQKDTTPPTSPRVRPVASPERQRAMRDVQNSQRRIDNLIEMGKRPRLSPFEAVKIRQDIEQERHNKKQLEKKRDLIPEPLERPPSPQEVTAPPVRQGPTQPGRAPPPGRIPPPPVQRVPAPRRRNIPPPPPPRQQPSLQVRGAAQNVRQPQVHRRIDRRAFGVASQVETQQEEKAVEELRRLMPDDMHRVQWNRHTQNFTIVNQRPPARVFNVRPNMIHGQHKIHSTAYNEIVYQQPPPKTAYNNRFFKMNPNNVFRRSVEDTDPITGTHSAFWGTIGKYIQVAAKPRAIHITFVSKQLPDRALKILVTRVIEHTHSNQVLNPRLLVVYKRKGKKIISMLLNAHQLRNSNSDRIFSVIRRAMRNSKHFILKQDNPGGHFHDIIKHDEILV